MRRHYYYCATSHEASLPGEAECRACPGVKLEHHITLSSEPGHTYMARFLLSGHRREAVVVLPRDLSRAEADQIAAIVAGLGAANEAPHRKESRCA
jgi:hypothetical protein